MPEQENKSLEPPGPSPTTKISRKGPKIEFWERKIEFEHENSTPEHEKSILEHENGSQEPPAPSPTTKNLENGPKTQKNPKNRKLRSAAPGRRPFSMIMLAGLAQYFRLPCMSWTNTFEYFGTRCASKSPYSHSPYHCETIRLRSRCNKVSPILDGLF